MPVIKVRSVDTANGHEIPGTALRTAWPQAAIDHALRLNDLHPAPGRTTRIHFEGSFVDDAYAELAQLAQQHGLEFDSGG